MVVLEMIFLEWGAPFILLFCVIWIRRFILVKTHLWREGLVGPGLFGFFELERQVRQKRIDERRRKKAERNDNENP